MTKPYQPKTGNPCHCKPGVERNNCPQCEGTGMQIDFKAIRERSMNKPQHTPGPMNFIVAKSLIHIETDASNKAGAGIPVCSVPKNQQGHDNASFIMDAFNVTHETGLTPRQLMEQNKALVEALRFYATSDNWAEAETGIGMQPSEMDGDCGHTARSAIAATKLKG